MTIPRFACPLIAFLLIVSAASVGFAQEEYTLSFEGRWFNNVPRPGNAHFTQIIGATHNSAGSLLEIGQQSSLGVENVAETGSTTVIRNEINARINAGTAGSLVAGTDGFISPEEVNTFNFFATDAHSQLTFLTMIAPSPDWFVGVHDLELQDAAGNWRDSIVLDLASYDAGTENGTGLSLENNPTNPRGNIIALDTAEPTGALAGAGSLARLTLTRVNAVPEPSSMTVLGAAFIGLLSRRRR